MNERRFMVFLGLRTAAELVQLRSSKQEITTSETGATSYHDSNAPHLVGLLRLRRERPRCRPADKRDELSSLQPIEMHSLPLTNVTT
jgi:hypothetical protein